jgi:hypothetical protein
MEKNIAPRKPKNLQDLKRCLKEEWDRIPQQTIDHLIQSIPQRFQVCLDHDGGFIGHLVNRTQTGWGLRPMSVIKELARKTGKLSARLIGPKNYGSTVICVGNGNGR